MQPYIVVYETKPRPDGFGGDRKTIFYEDENDFLAKTRFKADTHIIVDRGVSEEQAEILLCQVPDICYVLAGLDRLFDNKTGKLIDPTGTIGRQTIAVRIESAIIAVEINEELYNKHFPNVNLLGIPEHLKNLSRNLEGISDRDWLFRQVCKIMSSTGHLSRDVLEATLNKCFAEMIKNFRY